MIILLTLALLGADTTAPNAQLKPDATVASAIERAVVDRMGAVQVVVREISTTVADQSGLRATIEPGARLGQPIRFIVSADGKRVGPVVARLEVVGAAPRARRNVSRDEEITAADVDMTEVELKNVLLRRMPALNDVVGTRARRDIVAGEVLTNSLVTVPPAVRAGDEVRVTVTVGQVQVSALGLASGSGQVGDVIRVRLRPETSSAQVSTPSIRKLLNARIVARGAVEISR